MSTVNTFEDSKPAGLYCRYPSPMLATHPEAMTTCQACGKKGEQYAWMSGAYCSRECYRTLFDQCECCGQYNMSVHNTAVYLKHKEQLCDNCYNKKHDYVVVSYGGRFSY